MDKKLQELKNYIQKQIENNLGWQFENDDHDSYYAQGQKSAYEDILAMIETLLKKG